MKKTAAVFFVFLFVAGGSWAGFRIWSAKNGGNSIEAQFVQMSGSNVVLEKKDGRTITVPRAKLCAEDQEYLAGVIPPQIKVDVKVDVDRTREAEGSKDQKTESIGCSVSITKENKEPCSKRFKAYLYVIAKSKKGDQMMVLDVQKKNFSFEDQTTFQFSSTSKTVSTETFSSAKGFAYEGYVVFITDPHGKVLVTESNKSVYESKFMALKRMNKNDRMSRKFGRVG